MAVQTIYQLHSRVGDRILNVFLTRQSVQLPTNNHVLSRQGNFCSFFSGEQHAFPIFSYHVLLSQEHHPDGAQAHTTKNGIKYKLQLININGKR